MIRHIVAWNLGKGQEEEALKIKEGLEGLKDQLDYVRDIHVYLDVLSSSDRQVILSCLFDNEEDLKKYQVSPEHIKVSSFVKTVTQDRTCIDYKE